MAEHDVLDWGVHGSGRAGLFHGLNAGPESPVQDTVDPTQDLHSRSSFALSAPVVVADTIPVNHEDSVLKGHGTTDLEGEVVATLCGVVERVNKLVYVRTHKARYKPEIGDIIVGRVIEVAPKRWRLDINFTQDAVLMLSSMNLPDGIQRRRTAVDELNMRSIFEEDDVVCAEVRGFQNDGSVQLQARSQKYGKLERGQLLVVPSYLIRRRKQHFHLLDKYGVDLILGCNGFVWVGEHVPSEGIENDVSGKASASDPSGIEEEDGEVEPLTTPLETRRHICRMSNAVRLLASLGFTISVEAVVDATDASVAAGVAIKDMLGAEFYVQTAEREAQRRAASKARR